MSNIIKLKTYRYILDWVSDEEVEIDINKYAFFSAEYRLGSWHLLGYKCDKDYNWTNEELSIHGVYFSNMVDFIAKANSVKDKNGFSRCRVSRFNALHYCNSFYKELSRLLKAVEEKQLELKENENERK